MLGELELLRNQLCPGCGADCRNAFIGCNCKGDCTKATCPCKMAARECDPDKCAECWPSVRDFRDARESWKASLSIRKIFSSDPKLEGITEVNVKRKHEDRKAPCENMKLQLKEHAHVYWANLQSLVGVPSSAAMQKTISWENTLVR